MRGICVILTVALGGCGLVAEAQNRKDVEERTMAFQAAMDRCKQQFPLPPKSNGRAHFQCFHEAENAYIRPIHPHPDLLSLRQANQMAIVGKIERGEMTSDEANLANAKNVADVNAEMQRRGNDNRAVAAAEDAAYAANRSRMCTRVGNSVLCN